MLMNVRTRASAGAALVCAAVLSAGVAAQAGGRVSGRLLNSLTGELIAGITVQIDELQRQTTSAPDGTFTFDNVPPGSYHLSVQSGGYSSRRTELAVSSSGVPAIDVIVDPDLHFGDVVSVSAESPTSQFDAFQPTSVLAGQELSKQLESSLGETLENEAGVAARSFGPAPARPVIRGLSGDRILILQDGQRMNDLSSQSADHGVTVNPAGAERIEVVRGPATLLYGSNAIGGLVNVITEDIPTRAISMPSGNFLFDLGSAANEGGGAGTFRTGNGTFAMNAGGGGRRSSDVNTPEGEIANSQSRSGFGSIGLSWTGARQYFGGSYGYDDSRYGTPVVEDGLVELTPRKHAFSLRGGAQGLDGAITSYRGTLSVKRYKHEELLAGDVETAFKNDTTDVEILVSHRAFGRLSGSVGGWGSNRAFDTTGEEALSPAVDQRGFAAFVYEELTWPHVTLQFGGRLDRTNYEPNGEGPRDFTAGSGSAGLLLRPAAADDKVTFAVSVARAARNPALEELFFFGAHPGNFAFEVGNPDLSPEHAFGFDVSLRWRLPRASGEVTYFRNDIADFVFTAPLTQEEFDARTDEFAARFPSRDVEGADTEEFPIIEYVGADSVLTGVETHADFQVAPQIFADLTFDYVRGTLEESRDPLPRMPPFRFQTGLRYQRNALQAGGEIRIVADQDRIYPTETATSGYQLLRLYAAYSLGQGKAAHTITARLDNATNELYRNHLSLIKDVAPEMGRNFKLLYNVRF
jgi:iron complex outermembrane receptor protein